MQPIFGNSGNDVGSGRWTPNVNEARRSQEPISIPVRHVGRPLSTDSTDGPAAASSPAAAVALRGEGLQSPSVLMQSIKPARRQSNRDERTNANADAFHSIPFILSFIHSIKYKFCFLLVDISTPRRAYF